MYYTVLQYQESCSLCQVATHLFCSSSLANNSKSSGLNSAGDAGDSAGVETVVEEDVVCNEADGLAT